MSLTPAMLARLSKRGIVSIKDDGQTDAKVKPEMDCVAICITDRIADVCMQGVDFDRSTLPANWEEVIDENTGYPYYWNTDTEHVQWEPPTQDQINAPSSVREREHTVENHQKEMRSHFKSHTDRTSKSRHKERHKPYDRERKKQHKEDDDEVDPMDPSSYSDIPRGTWSTGLPAKGQGRGIAADETASGPLFQMRPYPNPGAVLKAQAQANLSERVGPNLPPKFKN